MLRCIAAPTAYFAARALRHCSPTVVRPSMTATALAQQRRWSGMGVDPSALLTSPSGMMALLYGRSSTASSSDKGSSRCSKSTSQSTGGAPAGGHRRGRRHVVGGQRPDLVHPNGNTDANANGSDDVNGGSKQGGAYAKLKTLTQTMLGSEAFWLAALIFGFSALWELCKQQKALVTEKVKNFFLSTLEIRSSQTEYAMIVDWMSRQEYGTRSRNLALKPVTVVDEAYANEGGRQEDGRSVLVPGYGAHIFSYKGTRLWISREQDSSKTQGTRNTVLDREHDILTITFFTRDREVIQHFLADVRESWARHVHDRVQILVYDYRNWVVLSERARRPLSTVFLPPETKGIVEEIRDFFDMQPEYKRLGVPWRRGYLLEGPPGTGKSSLVLSIASELSIPVCILSLAGSRIDDMGLLMRMATLPPRCILLMEDFENAIQTMAPDSAVISSGEGSCLTLSGLLNALDGVASSEGRVTIMTSNDASRIPLPDALLRPGRIDRRVKFEHLRSEELREMRDAFARAMRESGSPVMSAAATAAEHLALSPETTGKDSLSPAVFQQTLINAAYAAARTVRGGGQH